MDLLQNYSSSDESEEEKQESFEKAKSVKPKLSVPSIIKDMFPQEKHQDDPLLHQGRTRTFEHERGVWAGLVSVEVGAAREEWTQLLPKGVQPCDTPLHISLSRPLQMRHHWIQPLLEDLRSRAKEIPPFEVYFGNTIVLINEERTRTFLSVKVEGGGGLEAACAASDAASAAFNLPPFYKERRFHVSIGWALGDQENKLQPSVLVPTIPLKVLGLTFTAGHLSYHVPLGQ